MKIFVDSANLLEIEEALERGFPSGITTNPSILATEEKADFREHIVAQDRPVEPLLRHVPAEHRRIVEILGEMRAVDEQFLGHAAADDARAADLIFLGHGDARAIGRGNARSAHAARSGTDYEQVKIRHSIPPRCAALCSKRGRRANQCSA